MELSATGVLPRHRRFDLCDEPATMIHDLTRNSVGNVRFYPHDADSWSCLLWVLGGATNFSVDQLEVFAFNDPPAIDVRSLQETVELGGVRILRVRFSSHSHPLDHNLVVACGNVRGIIDLALEIIVWSVDDVIWIAELMLTSKLGSMSIYLRFWQDTTVFNTAFDLRKLPSAIAQLCIDALSLEGLPDTFVVDVSRSNLLFEAPAHEPSFKGLLTLPYARRHPRTLDFETTAFHFRNARSGDYVTLLVGRGTQWNSSEQTLRVFKGRQRLTNNAD